MGKNKYKILYNNNYYDYQGTEIVEIGKIIDTVTNTDVMYIYYDKRMYYTNGYHLAVEVYKNDSFEYPVATTDDLHRECFYKQPEIFLAMMLHELAHFQNGDLTPNENISTQTIADERLRCILEGCVQEYELKADIFAAKQVGKNTFIRMIDYLINKRKQRNDSGMLLAIKEFELRKKAVQKAKL